MNGKSDVTLPQLPGGWIEKSVTIGAREFLLLVPCRPDAVLEDERLLSECDQHGAMPYWTLLWPGAEPTARLVLNHDWPAGATAIELGCGVGLVGLAALEAGLQVTLTDAHPPAVDLAIHNARRNGWHHVEAFPLDWRKPPEGLFDLILGCEVLYDASDHGPILRLLDRMLTPRGQAWFGDAGRQSAESFPQTARRFGFHAQILDKAGCPQSHPRIGEFQLFIVTRASNQSVISRAIDSQSGSCSNS